MVFHEHIKTFPTYIYKLFITLKVRIIGTFGLLMNMLKKLYCYEDGLIFLELYSNFI